VGDAKQVSYVYTRYQDAVPFFVENSLTPAGATAASAVIKAWQAKGGKVLATSKAVPVKHVIASPKLSAEQAQAVRDYLLALDTRPRTDASSSRPSGGLRAGDHGADGAGHWL
jgi:ABC-type phosphate/phosphonate transport system substrate-binding protein